MVPLIRAVLLKTQLGRIVVYLLSIDFKSNPATFWTVINLLMTFASVHKAIYRRRLLKFPQLCSGPRELFRN